MRSVVPLPAKEAVALRWCISSLSQGWLHRSCLQTLSHLFLLSTWVSQVWRDLALTYASQQQHADAHKCVQHMRQLDPDSAASYHAVGVVEAACGNDVAAKAAYKAALALDAAYAPALLSLGECGAAPSGPMAAVGGLL